MYVSSRLSFLFGLCMCLFCNEACMQAQIRMSWQEFVEKVADEELADEERWTESMEELAERYAHPLDINTATREQLRQLSFLSEQQIEDIQAYIFQHQGMRSLGELMAIPSIDYRTRQYLSLFLWADGRVFERKDSFSLSSLFRHSRHEFETRFDIPLYYRMGYSYPPQSGGYRGSALYNKVRYQMSAQNHLEMGLSAEKDQGEPFRGNGGWDNYGAYLTVRNIGCLRSAIIGDYKMGFGEGLVVNTGFATGKTYLLGRPTQGVRAKRGMDEVDYFRGAAATFKVSHLELTAWLSHRRLDATLDNEGLAKTILTSGLHRTNSELNRKRNLGSTLAGGNLIWHNRGFHLGLTGYYQHFHRMLSPGNAFYRRYYPRGSNFGVAGVNYGYTHLWFSVAGETAFSTEKNGLATLNRVTWKVSPRYALSGVYRFYSYRYFSFYAASLSENSEVQNETGGMIRLDATPVDRLSVTAYADFFYNPWPRSGLSHSSSGVECLLQGDYQLNRNNKISARYQLKRKERYDVMETHNRLRLQYARQQGKRWTLQSILTMHALFHHVGWALSQRVRYQQTRCQLSALLSYFQTPNYDTRLYVYEPLLSNTFRYPSLYGHGLRFVAAGHYVFWKHRLMTEVLYGLTRYTDRKTQGSGMQEIRSPWKQDISIQLRLRI